MIKKRSIFGFLVLLIGLGIGVYLLLFSNTHFELIYSGIYDLSNNPQLEAQDVYSFTSEEQWDDFSKQYLGDGQIPDIDSQDNQILLVFTNPNNDKMNIYEITKIKRYISSTKIIMVKTGQIFNLEGFEDKSNVRNVMIYKVNPVFNFPINKHVEIKKVN